MKNARRVLMAVVMAFLLLPVGTVFGQSGSEGGGSGLSITPTRFEYVIERGEAELASIQVKNVTDRPILARAFLNDFEPDGVTGNPKLIIDENQEQSANSIRNFVVGLEDISIAAGETAVVNMPLQVPENAAPGAYYGAVRFQAAPPDGSAGDENAQLSLNASVAALVLIEVPGDITERIEVKSVGAYLDGKKGSLFTKQPNQVGIEIQNLGNGFSRPFGNVTVTGPWGTGDILSYELNSTSPRGNVLPNSGRLFLNDLSGIRWPGRYTINANISHGSGGEVLSVKSSFWYMPLWFIIALVVILAALVTFAWYLYRRYVTKTTRRRK